MLLYGTDGYILFGCDESGHDVQKLPSYIANVTVIRHGFPGYLNVSREFLGYSDSNPLYLPLVKRRDRSIASTRGLGRVGFDDAGGGDINCILIDVHVSKQFLSRPYSLSIYSVAESNENKHAIRVMDGDSFNLIAPTPLIDKYADGVWWTVHYNGSIRLKFMDIKGIFISAVAFGSPE